MAWEPSFVAIWAGLVPSPWPALLPIPHDYTGPSVLASVAEATQKTVEAAGAAHAALVRARRAGGGGARPGRGGRGGAAGGGAGATSSPVDGGVDDDSAEAERQRLSVLIEAHDHYAMLGLGDLNINATDDQIKKAYRRMVLRHHPDKKIGAAAAAATAGGTGTPTAGASGGATPTTPSAADTDPVFLAIQKAYDVLSNPKARLAYDSQYEFDDSIPTGTEVLKTDADFFAVYGPVFERNSRWSVKTPVPRLGGTGDDWETVRRFYAFWFAFDSWRDFTSLAEHKPEEAETREERRWMERENEKVVSKHKKAEVKRVADLVARAYARDPRVIAMKKAEEEEKAAAREAKLSAKRAMEAAAAAAEEERARAAAAEEEAKKAEAAAAKAAREREKKAVRRHRTALKQVIMAAANKLPEESACQPIQESAVDEYATGQTSTALAELVAAVWAAVAMATGGSAPAPGSASTPTTPSASGGGGDKEEEGGESADTVADRIPTPAAAEAVFRVVQSALDAAAAAAAAAVAAAKDAGSATPLPVAGPKPTAKPEWSVQETSMLAKGIARYPPGTRNRWAMIAEWVNGLGLDHRRSEDECIAKSRAMGDEERKRTSQQSFATYLAARKEVAITDKDAAPPAPGVKVIIGRAPPTATTAATPTTSAATASPTPAAGGAGKKPVAGAEVPDAGGWTPSQHAALQAALKTFPATMDKTERWKAIAEAVPGKNMKECILRFKEIREKIMAAKGGAGKGGEDE